MTNVYMHECNVIQIAETDTESVSCDTALQQLKSKSIVQIIASG